MESPDGTKTQGVAAGLRLHLKYQFKTKKKHKKRLYKIS